MKNKCKAAISCVCISVFLLSCNTQTSPDTKKFDVVPVEAGLGNLTDLKASEYFHKISYVPLETNENCLIGRESAVHLFGDKILVTSFPRQCMLFDRSGRFISSVGHVGEDPEGYSKTDNWTNERTGTIYFPGWNKNLITYQDDGTFRGIVRIPEGNKTPTGEFEFLNNGTIVQYANELFGNTEYLLFFRDGELIKKIGIHEKDSVQFDISNVQSFSILKSEIAKAYTPAGMGGVYLIDFKEADKGLISLVNTNHLWRIEDDIFFKTTYNDTIYQVLDTALIPVKVFDLGKYHWEYKDRFDKTRKDVILMTQILDSRNLMLFRFAMNVFNKVTPYNAILNKTTGELKIADSNNGIEDDLTNFIPLQPLTVSTSGEYASLLSVDNILTWFDEHKNVSGLPAEVEKLKQIGEEDNPVVVIME